MRVSALCNYSLIGNKALISICCKPAPAEISKYSYIVWTLWPMSYFDRQILSLHFILRPKRPQVPGRRPGFTAAVQLF